MLWINQKTKVALLMETRTAFFYKFLVSPRKIGSITPSSAYLTRKMLAGVDWQAEKLPQLLQEHQLTGVDCLISGLPFAAFPASLRNQILRCAYEALNPGGQFIAFQYTPLLYPYLKRQYRQVRLGFEPRNLPPAFVFTCTK
jgi:phospholipid N-methyltransferase